MPEEKDFVEENAAPSFAQARARMEAAAGEASESETWATIKSAARVGLYVGITAGTACLIIAGARAASRFAFGDNE